MAKVKILAILFVLGIVSYTQPVEARETVEKISPITYNNLPSNVAGYKEIGFGIVISAIGIIAVVKKKHQEEE